MREFSFDIKWLDYISINSNWDKEFDISHISPIKRRRLSNCAKSVFGITCNLDIDMPIVFSSNLGEINRFFELMHGLKQGVSPTSFSLSVLNAIPAILNIEAKNNSQILAISAKASIEYAILNALTQKKALVISYFEGINQEYYQDNPFNILIAMIIQRGDRYTLTYESCSEKKEISELVFLQNYGKKYWESNDGLLKWHWYENY